MIFIEDEKGKKIATATLSPSDDKSYPCVIDWFAVSKDCQGKKLAKPLLSKIIETAKKLGYDKILLHTQTNSWLAVIWLQKIFFEWLKFTQKSKEKIKVKSLNGAAEVDLQNARQKIAHAVDFG